VPPGQRWCRDGLVQKACYQQHVAIAELGASTGRGNYRCPVPGHEDHRKSFTLNPGSRGMWMVWHCFSTCSDADVRTALLDLGIDEECLGSFAAGYREPQPGMPSRTAGPATFAAAKRSYAMGKLIGCGLNNASLLKMCLQAISDGDGDLPGDPGRLLPTDHAAFIALAKRTGIERRYRYELARKWLLAK
jgi:hypothetical protein